MEGSDGLREACRELMRTAPNCYLTLVDAAGFPQTTAMLNLRNARQFPTQAGLHDEDGRDFLLYMTTGLTSPKVVRARANPKASVYFCDPPSFFGLMLGGEIEFVTDPDLKRRLWQDGWTMYYPSGRDGPEYGVLRMAPRVVKGWRQAGAFEITLQRGGLMTSLP